MRFADIPGLEEIKATLIQSVKNNHVAHAQMFMGRPGTGNLALAYAYATFVNCEDKQESDSCGACSSCTKMDKLVHPDIHFSLPSFSVPAKEKDKKPAIIASEWRTFFKDQPYGVLSDWANHIKAENKQCIISVDDSRVIVKNISLKAFEAVYKIVLMWLPELMNIAAANSILKALEEPPSKTLFLLVSQDAEKNLITILSRCQIVKVRNFKEEEVSKYLSDQGLADEQAAERAAQLADGNINKAMNLIGALDEDQGAMFMEWMRSCFSTNFQTIAAMADSFQKMSREAQKGLLSHGSNVLRDILMFHAQSPALSRLRDEEQDFVQKFSAVVTPQIIAPITSLFSQAAAYLDRNANPKITFFDLSIDVARHMSTARKQ